MKNFFLFVVCLLVFSNCSTMSEEPNKDDAAKALVGFYDALKVFDYETARTFCTDDFFAIEEGKTYNNLDEFFAMVKTFEGTKIDIDIKVDKALMGTKSGLLVVDFNGSATVNDEKSVFKAIENYSLVKEKGKWLIRFFHSSYLDTPDNINYKSVHLLKVPENLSVSVLDEPIQELNAVIASIGYPDCGYSCYQVNSDNEPGYTHVFEGKWLSPENYDAIHENPKYKECVGKYESEFKELFSKQVYLKVKK